MRTLFHKIIAGTILLLVPLFCTAQVPHVVDSLEKVLKTASGKQRVHALNMLSAELRDSDIVRSSQLNREALQLSEKEKYSQGKVIALIGSAKILLKKNAADSAKMILHDAVSLSEKTGYERGYQDAFMALIKYARKVNDPSAEDMLKQMLDRAEKRKDDTCKARFVQEYGMFYYFKGDMKNSLESFKRSVDFYEKIGNKGEAAGVTMNVGVLQYKLGDYNGSLVSYEHAYRNFVQLKDTSDMAKALVNFGITFGDQGKNDSALAYYKRALVLYKAINDKENYAGCIENMAIVYQSKGKYSEALQMLLECLSVREQLNDQRGIAISYTNIGWVYKLMGQLDKNQEYLEKALKINTESGDKYRIASTLGSLATVYREKKEYKKALEMANRSLALRQEIGDKPGIASTYLTLGNVAEGSGDLVKALEYYLKSLALQKEMGAQDEVAGLLSSIGLVYFDMKDFKKAIEYYKQSEAIWMKSKNRLNMQDCYLSLSNAYHGLNDLGNAYNYYVKYATLKDSMLNSDITAQLSEMNAKYESDKKEKEIEMKNLELGKKDAEVRQETYFRNASLLGVVLMLLLAFFAFRSYIVKRKANVVLEQKNHLIAQKNQQIEDSIQYALHIQRAMLPSPDDIYKAFPDCFGLFKPKDVVSGDFYWFTQKRGKIFIAAADCTGHGVPGGFMSMLGNDKLHDAVEKGFAVPAEILLSLNVGVKKALKQNSGNAASRDGMDIALLAFSPDKTQVEFAGANRPLWIIRGGQIIEFKGTKAAIGGFTPYDQLYDNHPVSLQPGDCLYIFSDGYADQFGGDKGKKFTTRRFRELLLSIHARPMREQEHILDKEISEWQSGLEQIDDVLVIGIRV